MKVLFCPFVKTNVVDHAGGFRISCEHGKLNFYEKESARNYINKYCGSEYGWKECSLACSLMQYYEKES